MLPAVAFQVTLVLLVLATLALRLWVPPAASDIDVGETETVIGGGGGVAALPVEPQPMQKTMDADNNKARRK